MANKNLEWYSSNEVECQLYTSMGPLMFMGLYTACHGNPCVGCAFADMQTCKRIKMKEPPSMPKRVYEESNAEMAKRLGISKRQAAKQRR